MWKLIVEGVCRAEGQEPSMYVDGLTHYPPHSECWQQFPDTPPVVDEVQISALAEAQQRLLLMQNTYLQATRDLLALAGRPASEGTWPKLEDTEYVAVRAQAGAANADKAARLGETLAYCLGKLTTAGVSWDDYVWTPELAPYTPVIP